MSVRTRLAALAIAGLSLAGGAPAAAGVLAAAAPPAAAVLTTTVAPPAASTVAPPAWPLTLRGAHANRSGRALARLDHLARFAGSDDRHGDERTCIRGSWLVTTPARVYRVG